MGQDISNQTIEVQAQSQLEIICKNPEVLNKNYKSIINLPGWKDVFSLLIKKLDFRDLLRLRISCRYFHHASTKEINRRAKLINNNGSFFSSEESWFLAKRCSGFRYPNDESPKARYNECNKWEEILLMGTNTECRECIGKRNELIKICETQAILEEQRAQEQRTRENQQRQRTRENQQRQRTRERQRIHERQRTIEYQYGISEEHEQKQLFLPRNYRGNSGRGGGSGNGGSGRGGGNGGNFRGNKDGNYINGNNDGW